MVRNNKKRHAGTTEFAHRLRTGISKRLSRNEYRILVEQAPVMIWRVNTNAECDYCNKRLAPVPRTEPGTGVRISMG